jgi:L,D-transpeptidase catalytic domain
MRCFFIAPIVVATIECGNQGYYLPPTSFGVFSNLVLNRRSFLGVGVAAFAGVVLRPETALASDAKFVSIPLFERAKAALEQHGARIPHRDMLAIADFSAASRTPRLHLVDLTAGNTTTLLVAHGRGSDPANTGWLDRFSNVPGSNASSNGSFLTGQTYYGKQGLSRRLIGLDPGNDNAEHRAIVIHSAKYVSRAMAAEQGRVGRSQGCFTVSEADLDQIMTRLGAGRLLFADKA